MNWVKALPQDELPEGKRRVVKIGERSILLIHHEGQVYAMGSACPHMRLPLKGGQINGRRRDCLSLASQRLRPAHR
jgi:nitrite reductase/ring-hydroxylating ferredoxin subunit